MLYLRRKFLHIIHRIAQKCEYYINLKVIKMSIERTFRNARRML